MAKNIQIGSVCEKKREKSTDPKEFYLRLAPGVKLVVTAENKDGEVIGEVTLEDGAYLNMQTPAQRVAFLVENEYITEEQGEERLENVPDYVKYEVSAKNEIESEGKSKKTSGKAKGKSSKQQDDDF